MKKTLCFSLFLLAFVNIANATNKLNVKDFGAKGDGKTDDTRAIQRAINEANADQPTIIFFPKGIYIIGSYTTTSNYFENYCLLFHSNLAVRGEGTRSVIKLADHLFDKKDTSANAHIFKAIEPRNVSFSDLLINMNGANNLVPPNMIKNNSGIFVIAGENLHIHDLTIKNCSGTNMIDIMGPGKDLVIENCKFLNGGNYVGIPKANSNQYDFSFIYTEWDSTIVKNNFIVQQNIDIGLGNNSGGIELHGSFCIAENNTITGCWPGVYITSRKTNQQVSIINNKMSDCIIGIIFWLARPTSDILIKNNIIQLTHARSPKAFICTGIQVPNGNVSEYNKELANGAPINDLKIINNTISAEYMENLSAGMVLHSVHQGSIEDNKVKGMNYAGVILTGSKWGMDSLTIENNCFIDFRDNYDIHAVGGYVVITDIYTGGKKNAPGFKNILIAKNSFTKMDEFLTKSLKSKGQFFKSFIELPTKSMREIHFEDNQFPASSGDFMIISSDDK